MAERYGPGSKENPLIIGFTMEAHDIHPTILNTMADTVLSGDDYYIQSGKSVYVVNEKGIEGQNMSGQAPVLEDDLVALSFTQSALQIAFTNNIR